MHTPVAEDEKESLLFIRKALRAERFVVDISHPGDDAKVT